MERYLYFGEDDVATTGESCMFALSSFLGMTPASATTTTMHFQARNGTAVDDVVTVTHTGTTCKVFMTEVVKWMKADQRNPFIKYMMGKVVVQLEIYLMVKQLLV